MSDSFTAFRCWSPDIVQGSVYGDIAMLGLDDDPIFMAAHTSLHIRRIRGATVEAETPEVEVLRSLMNSIGDTNRNTTIAITGPSGSGKSHLVRWLRTHLTEDDSRYHLIYVPRELATLRVLIERVLDGLPHSRESDDVRKELEKAVGKKPADQISEELLDRIRSVLNFETPDLLDGQDSEIRRMLLGTRSESDGSRRVGGLGDLLLAPGIRSHLLRSDGAIAHIVESLRGNRSGRDETIPEFSPSDLITKRSGIRSSLDETLKRLWGTIQRDPDSAVRLLNEVLPRAVAESLGMRQGVNLGEVFRASRMHLRDQGKDLVLLFEDLAQFGLFDGELFDQFVHQPGGDLAPIRSVFAITDGKFNESVPDTVATRLAHQFEIGPLNLATDGESLVELAARYLNVARVGKDRLVTAWNAAPDIDRESGAWIPNHCIDQANGSECPHRSDCWTAFGSNLDIGLYPYNRAALDRAARREGRGMDNGVTARVVVDRFIREFLLEAYGEIGRGYFPGKQARERFDVSVARSKDEVVPDTRLSESERDRLNRARVIWANGEREEVGITEAFSLPTADAVEHHEAPVVPDNRHAPSDSIDPKPLGRRPLQTLFDWESGTPLPNKEAVFYRENLYRLVAARIDYDSLLIDPRSSPAALLCDRLLARNSFEFTREDPGRKAGRDQLHFEILPNSRGIKLLSAVRWFSDHGHWEMDDPDRLWDFGGDSREAQIVFEEFLSDCAQTVEAVLIARIQRGFLDPSAACVVLRYTALAVLGASPPSDDAGAVLDYALCESTRSNTQVSSAWLPAANVAKRILSTLDQSWVVAFATARQGDTGDPQVVDASRLIPWLEHIKSVPVAFLDQDPLFDDNSFQILNEHWVELRASVNSCWEQERDNLLGQLNEISSVLGDTDVQEVVATVASTGNVAAGENIFRPQHKYNDFTLACDRLTRFSDEEIAAWLSAIERLENEQNSVATVIVAQQWAGHARQVATDIRLVLECLEETRDEVIAQLADEVGERPDTISERIADQLDDIAETLHGIAG
ncbi:MAG: ATP-binding protein [Acidimicrobiia bacterium]|nr:ATP-binding protein [Acidimicrobiia bacterium]MCY4458158.1 ATP-binding protein [Acidimicrobiaceae bacterium]